MTARLADKRFAKRTLWTAAVLAALPWTAAGAYDPVSADADLADAPAFAPIAAPAETPGSAAAWLDHLETALLAHEGRLLRVEIPSQGRLEAVFYGPLSALWFLTQDGSVADTARILREDLEAGGGLRLVWPSGDVTEHDWPRPIPAMWSSADRHPLAVLHDRLLSEPLAVPTAGLPLGSRFDPDGLVRGTEGAPVGFWRSHGDYVEIQAGDGIMRLRDLAELASRLGDRPSETGEGDR